MWRKKITEAPSLYLSKSNTWDIIVSHEGSKMKKIILGTYVFLRVTPRNYHGNYTVYCLKHLIFTFFFFASAQTFLLLHKLFPVPEVSEFFRDHCLCHEPETIISVSTLIISKASQPHPWDCVHITQVQSLLFLAESTFLQANPSLSCLRLLPYADVKGSHKEQWNWKEWGQKHLLTPPE